MQQELLEVLACPACRVAVDIAPGSEHDEAGEIVSGVLVCTACRASYPIRRGIPRMVPAVGLSADGDAPLQRRTADHFRNEFTAYAEGDKDIVSAEELEARFAESTGLRQVSAGRSESGEMSFLAGKRVLDGGCGPGRFTKVAASNGASLVVGLELGDHVDRAASRCEGMPNVAFVQGSVLEPPFLPAVFDYVFTLGVLHHTIDPKRGCLALSRLVKADGAMSVWVYSPAYWGPLPRRIPSKLVHAWVSRLPHDRGLEVCKRWLYPLGMVQMKLARRWWTRVLAAPLFLVGVPRHSPAEAMIVSIYDYYGPPIISTHGYGEVRGWLKEAGFAYLTPVSLPTGWFAERSPESDHRDDRVANSVSG